MTFLENFSGKQCIALTGMQSQIMDRSEERYCIPISCFTNEGPKASTAQSRKLMDLCLAICICQRHDRPAFPHHAHLLIPNPPASSSTSHKPLLARLWSMLNSLLTLANFCLQLDPKELMQRGRDILAHLKSGAPAAFNEMCYTCLARIAAAGQPSPHDVLNL